LRVLNCVGSRIFFIRRLSVTPEDHQFRSFRPSSELAYGVPDGRSVPVLEAVLNGENSFLGLVVIRIVGALDAVIIDIITILPRKFVNGEGSGYSEYCEKIDAAITNWVLTISLPAVMYEGRLNPAE
jgi:hypothetical protein